MVMADSFLGVFYQPFILLINRCTLELNLLKRPCSMEFYSVESEAEQQQLKSIYEHYVMANRRIQDEFIIGQYFERMHSDELSSMSWQD